MSKLPDNFKFEKPIYVTSPALPPLEEMNELLKDIWESKWLTNNGKYHQALEKALCEYLGVKYISLFSNGTLALITALQALKITGEVITTPFSFVATTHALWWNNIKPVFVDIEPETFNLDPEKIEASITPQTTAILPVHVYGNPCNVKRIKEIADAYGLKVIYDACHTFNVRINDVPVLNFGDLSVMSFHATKVYTTFEGGAIVCHDEATKKRIDYLKNFGFANETSVVAPGINAKMNEFQAALGLLQLKYINSYVSKRKQLYNNYQEQLNTVACISFPESLDNISNCYSYMPIILNKIDTVNTSSYRDTIYSRLKNINIFCRRYFYPLISQFPSYKGLDSSNQLNLKTAISISNKVLCLPLFPDLSMEDLNLISNSLKRVL